jgi:antirestriction protein ArdC
MTPAVATARTTDQLIESLTEGIARLATSDAWRDWLDMQRTFHRYSFNNCLLIAMQCPEASQVAGFHAWHHLGRRVRKGEKAIKILAPVTRRLHADEDAATEQAPRRAVVGFRAVAVFDVAQTDGEPLAAIPCDRLTADASGELVDRLLRIAEEIGYSVEVTDDLPGQRNGDCRFDTKTIRVRASNAAAQRVKTLAHELAHALLHDEGTTPREVAELEAESVAYVVSQTLDLDSSAYSFGYVATWAGGTEEAIRGIRASGERISRAARRILAAEGAASPKAAA